MTTPYRVPDAAIEQVRRHEAANDREAEAAHQSDPDPLYRKCASCHLFVAENHASGPDLAAWLHLHRGDDADELDESHPAEPGSPALPLAYWRRYGPPAMRARFTDPCSTDS